jgi:hypothetical protein
VGGRAERSPPLGPAGRRAGLDAADLGELVVAAVEAAVVVPDREPRRWFSWRWRWREDLIERLVEEGRLVRPSPGWLAADGV